VEPLRSGLRRATQARAVRQHQRTRLNRIGNAPEISQAVLDRRARHGNYKVSVQGLRCVGHTRLRRLDFLCLVENGCNERNCSKAQLVVRYRLVVGEHDIPSRKARSV
jgi:hypothetical protein